MQKGFRPVGQRTSGKPFIAFDAAGTARSNQGHACKENRCFFDRNRGGTGPIALRGLKKLKYAPRLAVMSRDPVPPLPLSILRKNVVSLLHDGVACEPALGVVRLRRVVG